VRACVRACEEGREEGSMPQGTCVCVCVCVCVKEARALRRRKHHAQTPRTRAEVFTTEGKRVRVCAALHALLELLPPAHSRRHGSLRRQRLGSLVVE
jgi:hypothetical protein